MNMGGLGQSCSFRARSSVCWSEAFYALTTLANSAEREEKWLMTCWIVKWYHVCSNHNIKAFTINSNLAVTIGVSSLEESLGLGVSECPRVRFEVLQEQSVERALLHSVLVFLCTITAKIGFSISNFSLLQFILLNEATLVLIDDGKCLLDVISRLASQTDLGKEGLVVEGAIGWVKQTSNGTNKTLSRFVRGPKNILV